MVRLIRTSLFVLGTLATAVSLAMTGGSVDVAFRGQWVPTKANCTSALKLVIEANTVTFVNDAQRTAYSTLEQCFSCAGPDVTNIVWLSTDAMGNSPFIIHLDTTKKQAVHLDFSNDKKLAARFSAWHRAIQEVRLRRLIA